MTTDCSVTSIFKKKYFFTLPLMNMEDMLKGIARYSFFIIPIFSLAFTQYTKGVDEMQDTACEEVYQKDSFYTKSGDTQFISYSDPFSFYDTRFARAEKVFSGKIKSIKEYCYEGSIDSEGRLNVTDSRYMARPYRKKVPLNAEYEFDKSGRLTFYAYSLNYQLSNYKIQKKGFKYEYNDQGLVSRIYDTPVDKLGPYSSKGLDFIYSKSGQLKTIVSFDHDNGVGFLNSDSTVFTYENGKLVELNHFKNEELFRSDMKLVKTESGDLIELEFDQCRLVKERIFTSMLEPFPHEMEYVYEGDVLTSIKYSSDKKNAFNLGENTFTLFPNGIVKTHEQKLLDGRVFHTTYNEHGDLLTLNNEVAGEYFNLDEKGNWQERVLRNEEYFNKNSAYEWVIYTERVIEYY